MDSTIWFIVAGGLFIGVALAASAIARWPLTTALLYLGVGVLLGPRISGLLQIDAVRDARALEHVAEIAVIVSLFTAGLKLRVPILDRRWLISIRLAVISMAATVAFIAAAVVFVLGLPWGVGIVIGAIVAPTDPVLASDVQVEHPFDQNRLRFALTSEASLNDGTAFPLLMLGLGLLGLHDLGSGTWRWLALDVVWATAAGLAIGGCLGTVVGKLVLYLRRTHREALGLDDFVALGLIALSYGAAVWCHAYGFLAVFAAGLALRRVERVAADPTRTPATGTLPHTAGASADDLASHPEEAPAYMAHAVLSFNEQLERVGELAIVIVVGSLLSTDLLAWRVLWVVPVLVLIVRPLSVMVGLAGTDLTRRERLLSGWFGIRGVGSVYYLAYVVSHGLPEELSAQVIDLTLAVIAGSIVLHGITVTPFMTRWGNETPTAIS